MFRLLHSAEETGGGAPSEQAPVGEATEAPESGATPEAAAPTPVGIELNGQSFTPEEVTSWQESHANMQAMRAANTQRAQELAAERQASGDLMRQLESLQQSMKQGPPAATPAPADLSDPGQMRSAIQQDVRELIAPIQEHIDSAQQAARLEQDDKGLKAHGDNVDRIAKQMSVDPNALYRRVMEQGAAGQPVEFFASQLLTEATAAKMGTSPAGMNGAPADPPSGGTGSAAKSPFKLQLPDDIKDITPELIEEAKARILAGQLT